MANINSYGIANKKSNPIYTTGKVLKTIHAMLNKATTDGDGTVVVLAKGLSPAARIHRFFPAAGTAAVTGLTDVDFGIYKYNSAGTLVPVDADILVDGQSFGSAITTPKDLMTLSFANRVKNIAELVGESIEKAPKTGYVLAATLNTAGSAAATLDFDIMVES